MILSLKPLGVHFLQFLGKCIRIDLLGGQYCNVGVVGDNCIDDNKYIFSAGT